jgi:hypothetical protein
MGSKKKSKTPSTPTTNAPPATAIPPAPPVALLIDGENVNAPSLIAHILAEAGKMGGVTIRQVYGNWSSPGLQTWKKYLAHYQIKPMGDQASQTGYNATDITLVIGAMDLLYSGIRHFCLVAGDSDYVPLVRRLCQWGCEVLVLASASASTVLKNEANQFYSLEELAQRPTPAPEANGAAPAANPPALADMLSAAYLVAAQRSSTEWVPFSSLGLFLRQLFPAIGEIYGKHTLSVYLKQCPDLFETRQKEQGNGQIFEARLRQSPEQGAALQASPDALATD